MQNPNEVNTKFSKRTDTFFFPVGDDFAKIVLEWVEYLKTQKLYGFDGPLFPKTGLKQDENHSFTAAGLIPECWQTTQPIRNIFREAFQNAGLKYYHPHSLRHTLAHYGEQICQTPEQFKAWSQNLGHESTMTTFNSYGTLSTHQQGELIAKMQLPVERDDAAILNQIKELLKKP